MRFDILTIFPEIITPYIQESLLLYAQEKRILDVRVHNLRDWTRGVHKSVDDQPFGGGLGMVMKVDPIYRAVQELRGENARVALFSPRGKRFTQKRAHELLAFDQLVLIAGRYEGVDERVHKYVADESLSIGPYVLMGGELPALIVLETIARLIPGVVGKPEFLQEHVKEGRRGKGFMEYPQYTRPEVFESEVGTRWKVPKILVSGNHKEIQAWRARKGKLVEQ